MKLIDIELLNEVQTKAKESPRLRMNYNFHQSLEDKCHRFLNAVEPGTKVPVHHHVTMKNVLQSLSDMIRWAARYPLPNNSGRVFSNGR